MPKSQRLIQLIMMINAKKSFTVQELADELGLSTRTITRDLLELSELGVPLYSVQGRGGGYRLLQERILPPISFTESEALAMFIACQSLEFFGSLPFDEGARSALHKFYHYLPADVQEQIDLLKHKVAIWSPQRPMLPENLRILLQAITQGAVVTIEYHSNDGLSKRDIQPYALYANAGYWYCPAYCFKRQDYRLFRADRIHSAQLNEMTPGLEEVRKRTLADIPEGKSEQVTFVVHLTKNGVRALESDPWIGPTIVRNADGSGKAMVQVAKAHIPYNADTFWKMGTDAQVVEPAEAVVYIRHKINSMAALYATKEGPHP